MKVIQSYKESRDKILHALDLIAEPVIQTLSPHGKNVMYQDSKGGIYNTNDGVTIAKQISSEDPIEDAIIDVIKYGALKTNEVAGDGTTTTILLTKTLIKEGMKLVDEGISATTLKKDMQKMADKLVSNLQPIKIKDAIDLYNIAKISANNDEEIATNVVDTVNTAGVDGLVFIEDSRKAETIIEKDTGFVVDGGLISNDYVQNHGFSSSFEDCAVMVCDKRLYYEEEAESIIRAAIEEGHEKLVIVARDFIGKCLNVFAVNHAQNPRIKLMLVKDKKATAEDNITLEDLSVYLGGELVTERMGKLVNKVKPSYFVKAKKVYANLNRAVLVTQNPENKELQARIKELKKESEREDSEETRRRLSSLTNGMVTVKVGGSTPIETQEKIFRYEDAINATRSAMKDGYLPGGGMALLAAFKPEDYGVDLMPMVRRMCESSIRQIAINSGEKEDEVLSNIKPLLHYGYNASTGEYEDVVEAGIIDPYKVTEMAIRNAVSIATVILTSSYYIVYGKDKDKETK